MSTSSPFPILETNRLILRQLTVDDSEIWFKNLSDDEVAVLGVERDDARLTRLLDGSDIDQVAQGLAGPQVQAGAGRRIMASAGRTARTKDRLDIQREGRVFLERSFFFRTAGRAASTQRKAQCYQKYPA